MRKLVLVAAAIGVSWAVTDQEKAWVGKRGSYWAFQKPLRPPVPVVRDQWVRTPVDAFLLAAMGEKGIAPSAPLERVRVLRRVYLDLTGLPPTPDEASRFLSDKSSRAYERLVDQLLASPRYGERWGLRWLDVVRYADTNGYEIDAYRPHAWRYRDYVVRAFNEDKPYDRFLKEQIAGDELYPGNADALIATGFHRAGPIHLVSGNQDEEANRQEVLSEITSAVGSVFLGITVQCAKCHNHKFDPILQSDYYRLQAVFAATEFRDISVATQDEKVLYEREHKSWKDRLEQVKKQIAEIENPYRERLKTEKRAKLDAKYAAVLEVPETERTAEQKTLAKEANSQIKPLWDEVVGALSAEDKEKRGAMRKQMHALELEQPDPPASAYAVTNMDRAPPSHVLKLGDPKHKMSPVEPGLPFVLAPDAQIQDDACGRRSALARWLASPDHPLTARVMVNRIWQFRMGTGLVATPNDFGVLGSRPSNQKLLDWLASEFVERGWSVKAIDRLIFTSSAYMQSTTVDTAKAKIDPDNKLYWRANRRRLEGEAIRDSVLAAAGTLNPAIGGKPVRVPIEPEIYDLIFTEDEPDNLWPLSPVKEHQYRRSLYLLNKRTVRLPMLANFDQPDAMTSCPERPASTHALQALSLMNSDFMQEQSQAFAARLERACAGAECRIEKAYRYALARAPQAKETAMAKDFLSSGGTLAEFCLALMNRNEFVYLP